MLSVLDQGAWSLLRKLILGYETHPGWWQDAMHIFHNEGQLLKGYIGQGRMDRGTGK